MSLDDLLVVYKELTRTQNNLIDEGVYFIRLHDLIKEVINDIDEGCCDCSCSK